MRVPFPQTVRARLELQAGGAFFRDRTN